jgi:hypothetical protein
MFISDEVRAEVSVEAAVTRLADLACGSSLTRLSHAAWDAGIAGIGLATPGLGLSRLVQVHCRGPVQRGAGSALTLRWEAADGNGASFPVLDADISLVPDGEQATLLGLTGVYRTPSGTRPDRPAVHQVASATIRTLLGRIADAISDPAAAHGGGTGGAGIVPGSWLVPSAPVIAGTREAPARGRSSLPGISSRALMHGSRSDLSRTSGPRVRSE